MAEVSWSFLREEGILCFSGLGFWSGLVFFPASSLYKMGEPWLRSKAEGLIEVKHQIFDADDMIGMRALVLEYCPN